MSFHFQGTLQEVIGWGLLGWKPYANVNGPIQCKALSNLGVTQIVCSEKGFFILTITGAVYTQNYKSTTLVSRNFFRLMFLFVLHLYTSQINVTVHIAVNKPDLSFFFLLLFCTLNQ